MIAVLSPVTEETHARAVDGLASMHGRADKLGRIGDAALMADMLGGMDKWI
jgi:hypothetical protein